MSSKPVTESAYIALACIRVKHNNGDGCPHSRHVDVKESNHGLPGEVGITCLAPYESVTSSEMVVVVERIITIVGVEYIHWLTCYVEYVWFSGVEILCELKQVSGC